jgi:hypothetical protein
MICSSRVATAVCLACLSYGVTTWAAQITFSPLVAGKNTEIVFKDGVGYDSDKLIRSVAGRFGEY